MIWPFKKKEHQQEEEWVFPEYLDYGNWHYRYQHKTCKRSYLYCSKDPCPSCGASYLPNDWERVTVRDVWRVTPRVWGGREFVETEIMEDKE